VKKNSSFLIKSNNLFSHGEKIVVGVSGGPDSVALLLALASMRKGLDLRLHIAHFDHGLRSNSGRDARFVEKTALRLGIPFTYGKIDSLSSYRGGSIEERARKKRFDFFFALAKKIGARTIALGHNRDDQAETILMRLLRGAGLQGLSAMMPSRQMGKFRIVRPLIETSRDEINSYLKGRKVTPCFDETNNREIYFRNKIRKTLIPLLEKKFNKNIKEILSTTAGILGQDYDCLNATAERVFKKYNRYLPLDVLTRTHPALVRLLIRKAIARVQGDTRRITFVHIREIEDLIFNRPVGSVVNLPKGVFVFKKKRSLQFSKE